MKNIKLVESEASIFDDNALSSVRLENETREQYKARLKENKNFMKMYKRFGRERFKQFMNFMKQMGERGAE
jgi:hypothetical protein